MQAETQTAALAQAKSRGARLEGELAGEATLRFNTASQIPTGVIEADMQQHEPENGVPFMSLRFGSGFGLSLI